MKKTTQPHETKEKRIELFCWFCQGAELKVELCINKEHDEPFSIFLSCANSACMDGKIGLMGLPTTKEALDSLTFVMEFREKANK